jgi:deoxyadenosine/deoxycytidine kinase
MMGMRHIAIAGNMGVGKSTLTKVLSERMGARAYFETVEDHPYLERFYEDMERWAFHSQFFFLTQAFSQHCDILASDVPCIQDRTIYEHYHVFATSLNEQGLLADDDFAVLGQHFDGLERVLPGPDLMVYLRASVPTLQKRIGVRDRNCESSVSADYLGELERRYETWMAGYRASDMMVVDTDELDIFNPEERDALLDEIIAKCASPQLELDVLEQAFAVA